MKHGKHTNVPKASRGEMLLYTAAVYPAALALANIAIVASTHAGIYETRKFARNDPLSQTVSMIASDIAGYKVSVACSTSLHDATPAKSGTERLGQVAKYTYLDPFLSVRTSHVNPKSIELGVSVCRTLIRDTLSTDSIEYRQDNFFSYAILLHELVHLESSTEDETVVQCQAVERMPEVLRQIGFTAYDADKATTYADEYARQVLTPDYHSYPCE